MRINISERVANAILKCQRGFASYFGRKTAGFGKKGNLILLLAVCLAFGGLSLFSVVEVFMRDDTAKSIKPDPVTVPGHFDETGEPTGDKVKVLSHTSYKQLQVFSDYMDSLKKASRSQYDSIVAARPGLMDSVLFLEQIYLQQNR